MSDNAAISSSVSMAAHHSSNSYSERRTSPSWGLTPRTGSSHLLQQGPHSSDSSDDMVRGMQSMPAQLKSARGRTDSVMRPIKSQPIGSTLGETPTHALKTRKLQEFTSHLHGNFADFVSHFADLAEQDMEDLKSEMHSCFGTLKDLLKQEAEERTHGEANLQDRCAQLERKQLEEGKHHKAHEAAIGEDLSAMKQRLDYLESMFGAWGDKHTKEVQQLQTAHEGLAKELASFGEAHDQHLEVEESLDTAVKGLTSAAEQTAKALAAAKMKLDQMHEGVINCEQRCASSASKLQALNERMQNLDHRFEGAVRDHSGELQSLRGDHSSLASELKKRHGELGSLVNQRHEELSGAAAKRHGELRDMISAEAQAREQRMTGATAVFEKRVADLSAALRELEHKTGTALKSGGDQLREIQILRDGQTKHTDDIGSLHTELGATKANLGGALTELEATRDELDQVLGLLASVQKAWRPCQRGKTARRTSRSEATTPKTPKAGWEERVASKIGQDDRMRSPTYDSMERHAADPGSARLVA